MPNICNFGMKIRGTKENCYKWLDKMRNKDERHDYYDEPFHFWRIFEIDISEEEGDEDNYTVQFRGSCAWSLASCCMAGGYSDIDLFAKHTKELSLSMETYSEECGCCFAEHYIYKNGECILDECVDYYEYYWDDNEYPTYADLKEKYPNAPSEQELTDNGGYWEEGGFEVWDYSI